MPGVGAEVAWYIPALEIEHIFNAGEDLVAGADDIMKCIDQIIRKEATFFGIAPPSKNKLIPNDPSSAKLTLHAAHQFTVWHPTGRPGQFTDFSSASSKAVLC